MTVAEETIPND